MNVLWRTLLVTLRARLARRTRPLPLDAVGRIRVRTLPTDIDVLGHMNNGRYLSLFDLGRWDLVVRTGLLAAARAQRWYPVVASETITFRRSLKLWQRFVIETRIVGYDERSLYMEHRAVVDGEVYARALVRARMRNRGGGLVSQQEFFAVVGRPEGLSEAEPWVKEWAAASALPSTRQPAPSTWQ